MSFQIATAKVDITPTAGANPYMAGYAVQTGLRTVRATPRIPDPCSRDA